MRRTALTLACIVLAGCATRADESGVHIELRAEGPHPGYVALQLYVANKPFDSEIDRAQSGPNACYEVTNEQGARSTGVATLSYDGNHIAGTLLRWGDVAYGIDVEVAGASVAGKASFGVGRMVNESRVSGSARPLHNFDQCRRLAQDVAAAERANP